MSHPALIRSSTSDPIVMNGSALHYGARQRAPMVIKGTESVPGWSSATQPRLITGCVLYKEHGGNRELILSDSTEVSSILYSPSLYNMSGWREEKRKGQSSVRSFFSQVSHPSHIHQSLD